MRPIRFRAWNHKTKEMITQDKTDRIDKCLTYYELNKAVSLMQFTGLRDKNGKEIYKGDILRYNIEGTHTKKEYWNPLYQVYFDAPAFKMKSIKGLNLDHSDFRLKHGGDNGDLEVIGNIYENPELLEVS